MLSVYIVVVMFSADTAVVMLSAHTAAMLMLSAHTAAVLMLSAHTAAVMLSVYWAFVKLSVSIQWLPAW